MDKRLTNTILIAAALATIPVAGCARKPETRTGVSARRGDIEIKVTADGNLSLMTERKLTFGAVGTVKEVTVKEGSFVNEGDVLARLDTENLELTVSTANLSARSAEIDLEIATDSYKQITYPYTYYTIAFGVPESLAAISGAGNNIENALENIKADMNAEELNEALRQLGNAQDNLTQAKEKLGRGEGPDLFLSGQLPLSSFWTLRDTQLNMEKAKLALDRANLDLKRATDELPKTIITSPMKGLVEQVNIKEGDWITQSDAGTKAVFYLIDPDELELKATVDEIDIPGVTPGQKAAVTLDAMPGVNATGEVTYIAGTSRVQGGVIVYDIKVKLDRSQVPGIKSGMTAKTEITTVRHENVLLIPERAIYETADGLTAVKITENGELKEKIVKVGLRSGTEVEVLEGLNDGDTVMVDKALKAA